MDKPQKGSANIELQNAWEQAGLNRATIKVLTLRPFPCHIGLAILGGIAILNSAPSQAQNAFDLLLEQQINIRQRTEINVAPPSVNVDVHLPKPKEGPYGRGKWLEVGTIIAGNTKLCRENPWWCSFISAINLGSISRKGSAVTAEIAFMPIVHTSRTERRMAKDKILFQTLLGNCENKTYWNLASKRYQKISFQYEKVFEFACTL